MSSLLVNSVQRLGAADPGFDYRQLAWIEPGLKAHGYGQPAAQAYLDQLRARTASVPDVKATSQVWLGPWSGLHMDAQWMGRPFAGNRVDPQFLDTMGIRLVRGRNFRPGENGVSIVSEAAARVLWPDQDAVGKSLVEDDKLHDARQIEETAAAKHVHLELPIDHVVTTRIEAGSANDTVDARASRDQTGASRDVMASER